MTSFGYRLNPRFAIKECSSCGALYTRDCSCSKGSVEDKILVPKPPKNCARCAKYGHPVNGPYCQGCPLLQEKLEEDLVTYFQNFQNTSESSDDSTNVINAPREPFVVKQDHGAKSSQNPPHIDECCCECGNALDGIFCQQCICKSCGKECSSCGALYTRDFCCSKGNIEDKILIPKLLKNCTRCAKCRHPVNGSYCQGCTLLRGKLKEDLVTYFQNFQNTSESSDDSTNVVNASREPVVVKQDHGSFVNKIIHTFSSSQRHCFHCKDVLRDGETCQRCTCTRCGSGLSKGLCYICGNNQNSSNDSPSIFANSSINPPHIDKCCCECEIALVQKGVLKTKYLFLNPLKNCARCAKCGHPVNGPYCQGCALLREKLEEDLATYFQNFQNTSESSDDSTNVINAPREPFVVKQDHDVKSSQNPPHIDECCCECGNALDGIFCQQCICKSCGKGAHTGYNCPPKVLIISNPKPCNQTINLYQSSLTELKD
nr:hypothetical protein [Tanacetum cinerariifolium]